MCLQPVEQVTHHARLHLFEAPWAATICDRLPARLCTNYAADAVSDRRCQQQSLMFYLSRKHALGHLSGDGVVALVWTHQTQQQSGTIETKVLLSD